VVFSLMGRARRSPSSLLPAPSAGQPEGGRFRTTISTTRGSLQWDGVASLLIRKGGLGIADSGMGSTMPAIQGSRRSRFRWSGRKIVAPPLSSSNSHRAVYPGAIGAVNAARLVGEPSCSWVIEQVITGHRQSQRLPWSGRMPVEFNAVAGCQTRRPFEGWPSSEVPRPIAKRKRRLTYGLYS